MRGLAISAWAGLQAPFTPLSLVPLSREYLVQLHAAAQVLFSVLIPFLPYSFPLQTCCFHCSKTHVSYLISRHLFIYFLDFSSWVSCDLPRRKLNSLSAHSHTPKYVYFSVFPLLVDDTIIQPLIQLKTSRLFSFLYTIIEIICIHLFICLPH